MPNVVVSCPAIGIVDVVTICIWCWIVVVVVIVHRCDFLQLVLECANTPEQNSTSTLTRKRRGGSLIQTIQDSKSRRKLDPLLEQLDPEVLATVVEAEMGCLERVADKMKDAADDVCFVSKYEVAHKGNSQCWTGSVLGR